MNNDLNDYNKELSDKYIENMRTKIKLLYFLKNILIIPFIIALFYWLPYGVMFLIGESSYLMKSLPSFTIMVLSFIGRKYLSYKLSTRWITIAGPKMFNIDMPMYLHNIQNKLIPKLAEKGIVLNYRYSYALLKNNNYISKIIESLTFTSKEVEGFFKQIEKVLMAYVDRKIG